MVDIGVIKVKIATGPSLIIAAAISSGLGHQGLSILLIIAGWAWMGIEILPKIKGSRIGPVILLLLLISVSLISIAIIAPDPITSAAHDAGSGIGQFFGNMWGGIASTFGGWRDGFVETMDKIYDFFYGIRWYILIAIIAAIALSFFAFYYKKK